MALKDFGLKPDETAIWFGILVLMVVEIGLIAPPVGLNVYVVNGMDKRTPIAESYRGVVPFPDHRLHPHHAAAAVPRDHALPGQADELMENLTPLQTREFLAGQPDALFLDCRSEAALPAGHPEGAVHVAWAEAPDWEVNSHFVAEVRKLVGHSIDRPVVIICRSGNWSVDAAKALESAGFTRVINVLHGFEGALERAPPPRGNQWVALRRIAVGTAVARWLSERYAGFTLA